MEASRSPLPLCAELIAIGDELLIGRTLDTNSHWLARELQQLGLPVLRFHAVPDDPQAIRETLAQALYRAGLVLTTGGLGPTKDDITKKVLAGFFPGDSTLVTHPPTLAYLHELFRQRGRELNATSAQMAEVPANCTPLRNSAGAAPGLQWETPDGRVAIAMPGVPYEMQAIFRDHVAPLVRERFVRSHLETRVLRLVSVAESHLSDQLHTLETQLPPEIRIAYNPGVGILDLRLTLTCPEERLPELMRKFEETEVAVRQVVAPWHYADGDTTLEAAILELLRQRQATLATAESCTGGALSARFVTVAGASDVLMGSVVAYSNAVKEGMLGVSRQTLETVGAVSEETARQMAEGVRNAVGTTYALSTTGIAGPDGGTPEKPVGTVWMGLAGPNGTQAQVFRFERDRKRNIERSVLTAMHLLWRELKGLD